MACTIHSAPQARRAAPETKIMRLCVLFLFALVGMSIATAALSLFGPGGEAGQELTGLTVVAGLGLMLGCAIGLLHAAAGLPGTQPGRSHRTASQRRRP